MFDSRRSGAGCLIAFAIPFAVAGVLCGVAAARVASVGGEKKIVLLLGCSAFAFGSIGFGLIAAALWGGKRMRDEESLRLAHPEEPWLWKREWVEHRIADRSPAGAVALWAFTLLWNAICAPVLVFLPAEVKKGNELAWVTLLFPIVGGVLVLVALRESLRALRFRSSKLVLDTLPAPIGGTLRGTVEIPHSLSSVSAILLQLRQVSRQRSGGETTEITTVVDERELDPAAIRPTGLGAAIPVEFAIPADASPSDADLSWHLVVDAELPGIDYNATFEIPVFLTRLSEFRSPGGSTPLSAPLSPRSYAERTTAEGHELYFAPFRSPAMAFWSLLATLFAVAMTVFTFFIQAPLFMSILFALVVLAMALSTLDLFFGSRTVILAPQRLVARRRLLWLREKSIPYGDIAAVKTVVAATHGAQAYYHVDVYPQSGRRLRVAKHIRGRREAEWVASRIRR